MEIYTFSGTGNSLHVARELAARSPDPSLVSIMEALGENEIQTRPEAAVQIRGRNTAGKGRYHHPGVRAPDIAAQKDDPFNLCLNLKILYFPQGNTNIE